MNQKGFANIILVIIGIVILVGVAGYFIVNQQSLSSEPTPFVPTPYALEVIKIKDASEVLGFGKYIKNPNNVPFAFIDARVLSSPDATQKQYYKLCGTDEISAVNIFTKYLVNENRDIILDDPNSTPEQKQQRMTEGYGTWHLIDSWKADTHYHYVIATAGEPFWKHLILEDCNYFTPTTEYRARTLGDDYSESIGAFKYSPKTADSFLDFLQYYYGRGWTYIAENKLHNVSIKENGNSVTVAFKVAIIHSGDFGLPTEYTYHTVTHTLDKKIGDMRVNWEATGARTSGSIDKKLLR